MIIFPRQITAEQMGFSFEFLVAGIIFALGRTFQNLEKNPNKEASRLYAELLVCVGWYTDHIRFFYLFCV